jgi:hypothetical protein
MSANAQTAARGAAGVTPAPGVHTENLAAHIFEKG